MLNDKKFNIPSYQVNLKDVITLDKKVIEKIGTLPSEESDFKAPSWLDLNKQKNTVKIISEPLREEIGNDIDINLIIEYYSR